MIFLIQYIIMVFLWEDNENYLLFKTMFLYREKRGRKQPDPMYILNFLTLKSPFFVTHLA